MCVALAITTGKVLFQWWDFVSSYSPNTLSLDREAEAPSPLPTAMKESLPLGKLQNFKIYYFQNEDMFSPSRRVLLGRIWSKDLRVTRTKISNIHK